MSYYHGRVAGPNGQVYVCEHNHRTLTAAVTCSNSSATRRMATAKFNRAAAQAAQAAALAKKRADERAARQARRAAAQEAATARRAAAHVAAEEAKAAKRAAKLASMSPQRAWKRMTPEERLLSTAESELAAYGEIVSAEAKAAYDRRAEQRAALNPPAPSSDLKPSLTPRDQIEPEGEGVNYEEAYRELHQQILTDLAKVTDEQLAADFAVRAARSIKSAAGKVHEFYIGEFIQILGNSIIQRVQDEVKMGQQAIEQAQVAAAQAAAELNARLTAANAAGDNAEVHAIWGEREKIQAAGQARVDAVSARTSVVALQMQAFEALRSTIGLELAQFGFCGTCREFR
jgi:hypothetical protein